MALVSNPDRALLIGHRHDTIHSSLMEKRAAALIHCCAESIVASIRWG
jgi:hypothetical protein